MDIYVRCTNNFISIHSYKPRPTRNSLCMELWPRTVLYSFLKIWFMSEREPANTGKPNSIPFCLPMAPASLCRTAGTKGILQNLRLNNLCWINAARAPGSKKHHLPDQGMANKPRTSFMITFTSSEGRSHISARCSPYQWAGWSSDFWNGERFWYPAEMACKSACGFEQFQHPVW